MNRILTLTVASVLVLCGISLQTTPAQGQDAKPVAPHLPDVTQEDLRGLRGLLGKTAASNLEGAFEAPDGPREGIPESVLRHLAEKATKQRGVPVTPRLVLENAIDELSRSRFPNGMAAPTSLEAIVLPEVAKRPALLTCNAKVAESIPTLWFKKLTSPGASKATNATLQSVGLISFDDFDDVENPLGTGWVVKPGILMTNRHVALGFAPSGRIMTNPFTGKSVNVRINFGRENCGSSDRTFQIKKVLHIVPEPGPDVALLEVVLKNEAQDDLPKPLKILNQKPKTALGGQDVYVAGYPFPDSRNPADAQKKVFADIFGVKRCAPGRLFATSGQDPSEMLFHDCSTLGGNSGSPLVALTTEDAPIVWGIHFAGSYKDRNFAWPMWQVFAVPEVKKLLAN
jgi:hypothetical protein